MTETFRAARERLLSELDSMGWDVARKAANYPHRPLKIPHATRGNIRLWFKPQAVWMSYGPPWRMDDCRSITSDMRGETVADLTARAETVRP